MTMKMTTHGITDGASTLIGRNMLNIPICIKMQKSKTMQQITSSPMHSRAMPFSSVGLKATPAMQKETGITMAR